MLSLEFCLKPSRIPKQGTNSLTIVLWCLKSLARFQNTQSQEEWATKTCFGKTWIACEWPATRGREVWAWWCCPPLMPNEEESLGLQQRGLGTDRLHGLGTESCSRCVRGLGGAGSPLQPSVTGAPHSGPFPGVTLCREGCVCSHLVGQVLILFPHYG